jgi:hypothetical protein
VRLVLENLSSESECNWVGMGRDDSGWDVRGLRTENTVF